MRYLLVAIFATAFIGLRGQTSSNVPPLDTSPMDMSYYPVNYPILKIQGKVVEPLALRIIYSRPARNGRRIFGGLQDYGDVWRMGANEATEIEFFKEVKIDNRRVKKGRYTLYAIPYADKWTIILNKDTDVWGSFVYKPVLDILRVTVPVKKNDNTEVMTIYAEKIRNGARINFLWEDVLVTLPVEFY